MATYQNQEKGREEDTNPSSETIDAETKEKHTKNVTDENRVGKPGLDLRCHLLWVPARVSVASNNWRDQRTAWQEQCSCIQ